MKLYVNDFSKDRAMGVTYDQQLIDHNLNLLTNINPHQTQVFVLGRYFALLAVRKKENNRRMLFFDLREDLTLAHEIVGSLGTLPVLQQKFVSMIELYNLQYETNFETVELSTEWETGRSRH